MYENNNTKDYKDETIHRCMYVISVPCLYCIRSVVLPVFDMIGTWVPGREGVPALQAGQNRLPLHPAKLTSHLNNFK